MGFQNCYNLPLRQVHAQLRAPTGEPGIPMDWMFYLWRQARHGHELLHKHLNCANFLIFLIKKVTLGRQMEYYSVLEVPFIE